MALFSISIQKLGETFGNFRTSVDSVLVLGRVIAKVLGLPTEFFRPGHPSARWARSAVHVLLWTSLDRELAVDAVENHRSTERPWRRLAQQSRNDVETVLGRLSRWREQFANQRCNRCEQVNETYGFRTQRIGRDFDRLANNEWPV